METNNYSPSRKIALLIGNSTYNTPISGLPSLKQPKADI